ncbi:MAG: hypothetical protein WAQ28_01515 [Bacteroidia bacterium]
MQLKQHTYKYKTEKSRTHKKSLFVCIAVLILSSLFYPATCTSQVFENPVETLEQKKRFIYGIDNRRTHIQSDGVLIYGLYLGIEFGGKLRLKVGASGTPFKVNTTIDKTGMPRHNHLAFVNLGEEFDFLIIKKFRFTTYVQSGFGYDYYKELDISGNIKKKGRNIIIPIELGLHANYDLLPWLRAKLGGGWRFVAPSYSDYLSGYYMKIGASIHTQKFIAAYKKKELFRKD